MSEEYFNCIYNLWTGFVGKATCEAGYLKCDGLSCPLYTPKKESKPQTNYDLLISKTPEELADFFGTLPCCPPGSAEELCYPENACGADTKMMVKCWETWLKSTVEEEE